MSLTTSVKTNCLNVLMPVLVWLEFVILGPDFRKILGKILSLA